MNDGLQVPGRTRQDGNAAENQLLHRLRGLAFQTPRARADAAIFQAGPQDRLPAPQWVIPQLGYDMRKFHEVKMFLEARGIRCR